MGTLDEILQSFAVGQQPTKIFDSMESLDADTFNKPVTQQPAQQKQEAPKFITPAATPNNGSLSGSQDIIQNLGNQLRQAQELYSNDPIRFAEEVSKIESTVAAKKVDFFKEAQAQAFVTYGIPDLERNLAVNKAKDNAPWFRQKYGMVDSDETIAAQGKLAAMRNAADGSIRESLLSNKTYQELDTYHKTFAKLAEGSLNSSINRQEKLRVEAAAEYASYTVEERDLLDKAIGNTERKPEMVYARTRLMSPDQKKMLNAVIVGGAKSVPQLALAGNPFAQNAALATETEVFGDRATAERKLSEVTAIASSNEQAMKTLINMGAPKDVIANASSLLGPQAKGTGKATSEDAARKRSEIAVKFAELQTQKTFDSDILSLKSDLPVPAFLQAAKGSPLTNPTGKIGIDAASALAMKGTPEQQRINRDELVAFYGNAAEKQNKSLFFKVNPLGPEKLKVKMALGGILGWAGDKLAGAAELGMAQGAQSINQWSGTLNAPFNVTAEALTSDDPFSMETLRKGYLRGQPFSGNGQ